MRVAPARQDLPAGTSCSSFYRFRWSRTGRFPSSLNCQCADRSGAAGARTPNLRRARAALSQLSYDPRFGPVGAPGLEPGTSALSGPRSNQLSYAPRMDALPAVPRLPVACPARRPKMEDTRSPAPVLPRSGQHRKGEGDPTRPPGAWVTPRLRFPRCPSGATAQRCQFPYAETSAAWLGARMTRSSVDGLTWVASPKRRHSLERR